MVISSLETASVMSWCRHSRSWKLPWTFTCSAAAQECLQHGDQQVRGPPLQWAGPDAD